MKIGPVDSGDRSHRPDEEKRKADVNPDAQRQMNQTDKVEISGAARSLSEKELAASEETGRGGASELASVRTEAADLEDRQNKIEQARNRIESGYYESSEVKEEIARRITDDFVG